MSVASTIENNRNAVGLAIVITNQYLMQDAPLPFTEIDGNDIEAALKCVGFAVHRVDNLDKKAMIATITEAAQYASYPSSYKMFAFAFSGHGGDHGNIFGNTFEAVNIENDLLEPLFSRSLDSDKHGMVTFPKLFFIDACRGLKEEHSPPKDGNYLLAYATLPKFNAFGNKDGSYWMPEVAAIIERDHECLSSELTSVNAQLQKEGKAQVAVFTDSLFQPVCLQDTGTEAPAIIEVMLQLSQEGIQPLPCNSLVHLHNA